jgi:hypothetical protein
MKRTVFILATLLTISGAYANCILDGARTQSVALFVEGREIDRWDIASSEVHRVRLPQGFELGLQIEPATPERYRELLAKTKWRSIDELVKVTLLDMSTVPPYELSTTWGGANSKQGFGPRGGANGVPKLIDQVELWLHNPVCVAAGTIPVGAK